MIVYQSDKTKFLEDILTNNIDNIIDEAYFSKLGRYTSPNEKLSWSNSLMFMNNILLDDDIPKSSKVSIEFQIPLTSKRIDFIITGLDDHKKEQVIIIELKQWSKASLTDKDAIVKTRFQHGETETAHPSYQAWSYATMIKDYNQTVQDEGINLIPCAYLHNYNPDNVINNPFYLEYITKAPIFLKPDALKLRDFIKQHIKFGDNQDILYKIENGRIRPSKQLADSLASMLKGNQEFIMIDDQKVVFETAISIAKKASTSKKQVLIVEGGPGTGKSVVAINLLVHLTNQGQVAKYISKNAAPREVYSSLLSGSMKKSRISNLFGGTGAFIDTESDIFDTLIVDEAHRLNLKSGLYQNLGENQVLEIIDSAKFSIFFIDDNQRIHIKDIGSKAQIEHWAKMNGATVNHLKLESQFRCNGSDGYLAWLDNTLQIKETANIKLSQDDFDFRIFADPNELRNEIIKKNLGRNKSRMVAGYCWDWDSKKHPSEYDVILPEHQFSMRWNLQKDGSKWIIGQNSINEIGCIHTCQGLELDYIGVVVGKDLRLESGKITTDVFQRSNNDHSIRGIKKLLKENKEEALQLADRIIKNTYRTLFTRGMKGCYVYFCDKELENYFSQRIMTSTAVKDPDLKEDQSISIRIEPEVNDDVKYIDYLPLYSLKAACGAFGEREIVEENGWIKVGNIGKLNRSMFIVKANGDSMEPRIKSGDYCVFRANVIGSRNNKIVLVQHNENYDADYDGSYSIKKYTSTKQIDQETQKWEHSKITLEPLNKNYNPIIIENDESFMVIGEFISVVK